MAIRFVILVTQRNTLIDLMESFRCQRAIPLAFRHLISLLPIDPVFVSLRSSSPRPANPTVTFFLIAVVLANISVDCGASFSIRNFQAIIKVTKCTNSGEKLSKGEQYYGLLANCKFVINKEKKLIGGKGSWLQISNINAEDCIRPEGCGIMIGNREDWDCLDREDGMRCDKHQCY